MKLIMCTKICVCNLDKKLWSRSAIVAHNTLTPINTCFRKKPVLTGICRKLPVYRRIFVICPPFCDVVHIQGVSAVWQADRKRYVH